MIKFTEFWPLNQLALLHKHLSNWVVKWLIQQSWKQNVRLSYKLPQEESVEQLLRCKLLSIHCSICCSAKHMQYGSQCKPSTQRFLSQFSSESYLFFMTELNITYSIWSPFLSLCFPGKTHISLSRLLLYCVKTSIQGTEQIYCLHFH